MPILTGSPLEEAIAQINADNPTLPWPINSTDFIFGKPVVVAADSFGRNTKLKITAKSSSKYRGVLEVLYRRRDLTSLFRGNNIAFTRWLNDGATMTMAQAIGYVNQLYGVNLTVSGISGAAWSYSQNATPRVWSAVADNLAYVGSFTVTWNRGLQQIGIDILTVTELDGGQWPGGNDFVAKPDRSLRPEFVFAGLDFTEYALAQGWTAGGSVNLSGAGGVIAEIQRQTSWPIAIGTYNADTAPWNMSNGTFAGVALPSAAHPEANKPGFAYAKILTVSDASNPRLAGKWILYFNL